MRCSNFRGSCAGSALGYRWANGCYAEIVWSANAADSFSYIDYFLDYGILHVESAPRTGAFSVRWSFYVLCRVYLRYVMFAVTPFLWFWYYTIQYASVWRSTGIFSFSNLIYSQEGCTQVVPAVRPLAGSLCAVLVWLKVPRRVIWQLFSRPLAHTVCGRPWFTFSTKPKQWRFRIFGCVWQWVLPWYLCHFGALAILCVHWIFRTTLEVCAEHIFTCTAWCWVLMC